jgi:hypothetical protein
LFGPEFWCGESCHNELFSCSFISSIFYEFFRFLFCLVKFF